MLHVQNRARISSLVFGAALLVSGAAYAESGKATYYTTKSCQKEGTSGVFTASGERYDEAALTCALPKRGFGGRYKVTNLDNGKAVICRHNDYGPGRGPRARGVVIDLSPAAYDAIGGKRGVNKRGVSWGEVNVSVEALDNEG